LDVVNSDVTIRATGVDSSTVGRPTKGNWSWWLGIFVLVGDLDLSEQVLGFICDIPDLDTSVSGNGQPLVGGVESQSVDHRFTLVFHVWLSQVMVVPHLDDLVFTTGGDVETVLGDIKSIDVGIVGLDGSNLLEKSLPDFKSTVPTSGGVVLGLLGLRESDLGNPVLVIVRWVWWGVGFHFAFSKSVPQVDGVVGTGREDLSVVSGERAGQNFLVVAIKPSIAFSGSQIPQSHGLIPR